MGRAPIDENKKNYLTEDAHLRFILGNVAYPVDELVDPGEIVVSGGG